MRTRRTAGVLAVALIAGGALASPSAQANSEDTAGAAVQEASAAADGTVVLPTGDKVTILPNGTAAIEPAEGREDIGFVTPSPLDGSGEIIAVPFDRVADIEAGLEDPRRYNVTRLLEAGVTDASAAAASELDEREYTGLLPDTTGDSVMAAGEAQKFSVILHDRDGAVPDYTQAHWAKREGGEFDRFTFDADGVASAALAPGEYVIVYEYENLPSETERGERLLGMTPVTISDSQVQLFVDSAAAHQVSAAVERDDAEYLGAPVFLTAHSETDTGEPFSLGAGGTVSAETDLYVMPEPDLPEFRFNFMYQPTFTSPEGGTDPYIYNLALGGLDEYPSDTAYSFTDDELAQVETTYQDLGAATSGHTCDYGDFTAEQAGVGLCRLVPVEFPSTRTMLYTADPDTDWDQLTKGGIYLDGTRRVIDGFVDNQDGAFYEAGETERTVLHGAFSAGAPEVSQSEGDEASKRFGGYFYPGFSTSGEVLEQIGYEGNVSLSRDGVLITESGRADLLSADIPTEPGRYTIEAEAKSIGTFAEFATASLQSWNFDLGAIPEAGYEYVDLPAIGLRIEDAEGGWVEDDGSVEVTLQARAGTPALPVELESMTFEVSYDDGKTWKQVSIDQDGGSAEAELCPPRRAEFVSVRMTGVDTAGTEFSHTTIRSFGLD